MKNTEPDVPTEDLPEPPPTPVVYESVKYQWKYKHIRRFLDQEPPLDEAELNELGKEGWELITIFTSHRITHYYFKQPIEP